MARSDDEPTSMSSSERTTTGEEDDTDDVEAVYGEEYEVLNTAMDEISACLDDLERKSNDLFTHMRQFLEEAKQETRMEECSVDAGDNEA